MNFQESYFYNDYGLSCVEDYIIYILGKETSNWVRIFYKSYFDVEEILNYLLFKNQEYSSVNFIERIQDTLVKDGILSLEQMCLKSIGGVRNFFLVELKQSATKELLNINTWRSDHFIMCSRNNDGEYLYVNDRPYITGSLERSELLKYAAKEYVLIVQVINKDIGTVITEDKIIQLEQKLKSETLLSGDLYFGLEKIRDGIGIYRVVVKRLQAFFCSYRINIFIKDEIRRIDNIYLKLEYMNIRKNYDLGKVNSLICEALYIQKTIKKKMLDRMDIIYDQCR